ncbi:hypothetical protein [Rhizobium ruizarguesonis]|nr:hypothetical protein [Rhizobium ruizarguesonis]
MNIAEMSWRQLESSYGLTISWPVDGLHEPINTVGLIEKGMNVLVHDYRSRGGRYSSPVANKQLGSDRSFERLDVLADGGLGQIEQARSAGHRPCFHDSVEYFDQVKVPEFHLASTLCFQHRNSFSSL